MSEGRLKFRWAPDDEGISHLYAYIDNVLVASFYQDFDSDSISALKGWSIIDGPSQIGMTTDNSPSDICAAMPDKSIMIYYSSGTNAYPGGLVPVSDNGILKIIRWTNARIALEFIGEHNTLYTAFYRSGLFTEWRSV